MDAKFEAERKKLIEA
jgi:ABC-type transport system involved in cytochrome bd biosynthesis fused ATPase/permease subunit